MAFDAVLGVREIYSTLGPLRNHAILKSEAKLITQAAFECGCVIEYANHREPLRWEQCDEHRSREAAIFRGIGVRSLRLTSRRRENRTISYQPPSTRAIRAEARATVRNGRLKLSKARRRSKLCRAFFPKGPSVIAPDVRALSNRLRTSCRGNAFSQDLFLINRRNALGQQVWRRVRFDAACGFHCSDMDVCRDVSAGFRCIRPLRSNGWRQNRKDCRIGFGRPNVQ